MQKIKFYLWQIAIALDQLVNTLLGGWADETLSSRAYRHSQNTGLWRWKFAVVLINGLFCDRHHSKNAYLSERDGKQLPPEFRADKPV